MTSSGQPSQPPAEPSPSHISTAQGNPPNSEAGQLDLARSQAFFTNSAIVICVLCPAVALAPPRKFDLYSLGLGVAFFTSAGFLVQQKTGHGLLWHIGYRLPSGSASGRLERQEIRDGAVWQGERPRDWVQERKEQEELYIDDEKKGYGSLIWEQVRDVWRREKENDEDTDKKN